MNITPTAKWQKSKLIIPGKGTVFKPRGETAIQPEIGQWLVENGYAIAATAKTTPDKIGSLSGEFSLSLELINSPELTFEEASPEPKESKEIEVGEDAGLSLIATTSEKDWQIAALDFLNQATPQLITEKTKKIGVKTANQLVESRVLNWATVEYILSAQQLRNVEEVFNQEGI
ncbi:MAG: hypothetical protein WBB28_01565 [Crinalium sp.]